VISGFGFVLDLLMVTTILMNKDYTTFKYVNMTRMMINELDQKWMDWMI